MTQATGGVVTQTIVNGETFRIHTFTSSDNFVVTEPGTLQYLLVGGGGGGASYSGGGGGGGGFLTGSTSVTSSTTYPIVIGAGGAGANINTAKGAEGVSTTGFGLSAVGGGGGASYSSASAGVGGSGGGGSGNVSTGAAGTAGQGFAGGNGVTSAPNYGGGGGGGAGGVGANGTSTSAGNGGVGASSSITGIATFYAGGGGGSTYQGGTVGLGGAGGGGLGGVSATNTNGSPGGTNTGGGGGGASYQTAFMTGGTGGSGIAIVQYSMGFVSGVNFQVSGTVVTAADEGSTVTVVFVGTAATGAINYNITGVSSADISGAALSGTVNLVDYVATITFVLTADGSIGEGAETMTVSFVENSVTYQESLTVNDTSVFVPAVDVFSQFIASFDGTVKYVDIANGSDTNNGDTEAAAYQTLPYAQAQTNGISTAVMYVILPGTYNLTSVAVTASGSAAFSDGNLPRTFFCSPGQVTFQWTAGAERDGAMVGLQNNSSAVYGAIFKRNNNNKTLTYAVAMFNNTTAYCQGDFYNCVFQETNANGNWSLQYDNSAAMQATVNNCSFYTIEAGSNDHSGGAGLVLNNCAFTHIWGTTSATRNNAVTNQTIDPTTYELSVDNTTYGVYSGTYAWGQALDAVTFYVNGNTVTAADEGQAVIVLIRGQASTGSVNYTITGVSSADIDGAGLTGTVNLVDSIAYVQFNLTEDISIGEGAETLTFSFVEDSITYQADLIINDTSSVLTITPTAAPGETVTVALNTVNSPVANGTEIAYTISGEYITAEIIGQPLTGVFVVNNNTAEFTIAIGLVSSTVLTVTALGSTVDCVITFIGNITDIVVESDYTDTEVNTATFSILPFSSVPITLNTADNVETGFVQISTVNYVNYAAPTTVTDTVENGGALNIFIVQPLGQALIREFWI